MALPLVSVLLATTALLPVLVKPAAAQGTDDEIRAVDVSYEIGAYDSQRRDWAITAVVVRGDLDPEQDLNVELWADGYRLWAGTSAVTLPETRLAVDGFVPVGELVEVGIWQQLPEEAIAVILPVDALPDEVLPPEDPEDPEDEAVEPEEAPAPVEVGGVQIGPRRAEILGGGSGGGSSGQLALSMVLTVVVLMIVLRTPLPSATTQRWTK